MLFWSRASLFVHPRTLVALIAEERTSKNRNQTLPQQLNSGNVFFTVLVAPLDQAIHSCSDCHPVAVLFVNLKLKPLVSIIAANAIALLPFPVLPPSTVPAPRYLSITRYLYSPPWTVESISTSFCIDNRIRGKFEKEATVVIENSLLASQVSFQKLWNLMKMCKP